MFYIHYFCGPILSNPSCSMLIRVLLVLVGAFVLVMVVFVPPFLADNILPHASIILTAVVFMSARVCMACNNLLTVPPWITWCWLVIIVSILFITSVALALSSAQFDNMSSVTALTFSTTNSSNSSPSSSGAAVDCLISCGDANGSSGICAGVVGCGLFSWTIWSRFINRS